MNFLLDDDDNDGIGFIEQQFEPLSFEPEQNPIPDFDPNFDPENDDWRFERPHVNIQMGENKQDDLLGLFNDNPAPIARPAVIPAIVRPAPIPAIVHDDAKQHKITPKQLHILYTKAIINQDVDFNILGSTKPCSSQNREKCKKKYYQDNRNIPSFNDIKCIPKTCLIQICKELNLTPYSANTETTASKEDILTNIITPHITRNPHIWCFIHKYKTTLLPLLHSRQQADILNSPLIATTSNLIFNTPPTADKIPKITYIVDNIAKLSTPLITTITKYMITVPYSDNTEIQTFAQRITTTTLSAAAIAHHKHLEQSSRSKTRIVTIISLNPIEIILIHTSSNTLYHIHERGINNFATHPLTLSTLSRFTTTRDLNVFTVKPIEVPNGIHIPIVLIYYFIRVGKIESDLINKLHENIRNTRKLTELATFLMGEFII